MPYQLILQFNAAMNHPIAFVYIQELQQDFFAQILLLLFALWQYQMHCRTILHFLD